MEATPEEQLQIEEERARILEKMKQTIGPIIRDRRERKGLSQEALGKVMGVSRQAVSMWESGTNLPDIPRLVVMAEYLDAPELSAFAPRWYKPFADRTVTVPDDYVRETPFHTTKLLPGSPDQFVLETGTMRFADTPPAWVGDRRFVDCLSVSTNTMMPWRFPSDAVYYTIDPPRAGQHVIIQLRATPPKGVATKGGRYQEWANSNAPHVLKKLVAFDFEEVRVGQYNPEKEEVIARRDIHRVWRVIERDELYNDYLQIPWS